ncbi:MAG: DUF72 domain-containing protein [Acidobacteria bacterium]|nr:DUF72 domain-containing protein [Acidobacteriota bacterium]
MAVELHVGTSGYSYKEWKGSFYPPKLPANEMLHFYAQQFDSVEINNTFYRMPDEKMLATWNEQVPDGFTFSLKAPRRISHIKRLRDCEPDVAEFVRRAATLANKLGPLLVQLPPFTKVDVGLLHNFLAQVPAGPTFAFEFRHASWLVDEVYECLRAHGAMLCVAETDDLHVPLIATTDTGYLRLRELDYDDQRLTTWAQRVAAQPWTRAYVYFKHEDEALGPKFARRFVELWKSVGAHA